jgi:hypothetical protein
MMTFVQGISRLVPQRVEPAHAGHPEVHQDDFRAELLNRGGGFLAVPRLPEDADSALRPQQSLMYARMRGSSSTISTVCGTSAIDSLTRRVNGSACDLRGPHRPPSSHALNCVSGNPVIPWPEPVGFTGCRSSPAPLGGS